MVTGQDNALVQDNRAAFTRIFDFRIARYTAGSSNGGINIAIDQTEFQSCSCTKNLFGTCSILNTRQLNDNTI
ncbi:Uncharacterised protein [Yersinia enterocolitica]|nr:Uncharacterised protein [Yersinia enterocolitica]